MIAIHQSEYRRARRVSALLLIAMVFLVVMFDVVVEAMGALQLLSPLRRGRPWAPPTVTLSTTVV